jgi:hypothetical protein
MIDPGDYARRVRARPYGPEEVTAGGITAWFHGPFTVLTFASTDGIAITVTADSGSGKDLADLFAIAQAGRTAELDQPDRLTPETPAPPHRTPAPPARVLGLAVRPVPEGAVFTITLDDQAVEANADPAGLAGLTEQTRRWALAR